MAKNILMPQKGLTETSAILAQWLVKVGDVVEIGTPLFDIETGKATFTVESDVEGIVLAKYGEAGDEIDVGAVVLVVGKEGEQVQEPESISINETNHNFDVESVEVNVPASMQRATIRNDNGCKRIFATPLARKLAKENGVDLSEITPTSINGRISKDDVLNAIECKAINKNDVKNSDLCEDQKEHLNAMRKVIARRMSESWHTSPRVCYECVVDATNMQILRERLKKDFEQKGQKLTYNHIIMMAVAKSLKDFKSINASLNGDDLLLHPHINIGIAVGVENGLLVPNLKNCENLSLTEISKGTEEMIARAHEGKLSADELTGGTFTITNLGMFGMRRFTPIINQPELAILGVNAIVDTPIAIDGNVVIRPMMTLDFVADHRVIDGMLAAKFLKKLTNYIEMPSLMLA